jgi:hypothetical protein
MFSRITLPNALLTVCALLMLGVFGCAPLAPLHITPTPALLSPDAAADRMAIQRVQMLSGARSAVQMTPQPPAVGRPTVTWLGPVIGPGYVLPPTQTPVVPGTSEPRPTPTPGAAPTATIPGEEPLFPDVMPYLDPVRIGMQIDLNLEQRDWDEVMFRMNEHLPLGWVKFQLPWRDVAPNAPGELSAYWQRTRLYLEDAQRRGFRIMLSIAKAPPWARSVQAEDGPPDDPAHYAAFITQILNEVGGSIHAIEVWNEPNLRREWQGRLPFDGSGYMRLFVAAYSAIRAWSPGMIVVSAGLAPTGNSSGSRDDRSFLREMYAAGLGNYRDIAVGVHPYSWANPPEAVCCSDSGWDDDPHFFYADNVRDYRQIMVENGHSDVQMWVTEFGYATWYGFPDAPSGFGNEWILRNTHWDQGNYTIRMLSMAQSQPWMGPVFLWNLNFAILPGLLENRDERVAYSLIVPGREGEVIPGIDNRTERPLYWMLHDAINPDIDLDRYD